MTIITKGYRFGCSGASIYESIEASDRAFVGLVQQYIEAAYPQAIVQVKLGISTTFTVDDGSIPLENLYRIEQRVIGEGRYFIKRRDEDLPDIPSPFDEPGEVSFRRIIGAGDGDD